MIRIVTDSTADMPPALAQQLGVTVVPLNVHFGTETLRDGVDITIEQFYERLARSVTSPTTSQPSPGIFKEVYQSLLKEAEGVVCLTIASQLSGTCNSARQGKDLIEGDPPISVIDSGTVSLGLTMFVARAAEAARAGKSREEIVALVEDMIPRMVIYLTLDTLEYLQRGGRIGRASALLGTMLSIKPILKFYKGDLSPLERVRTRSRSIQRLGELAAELKEIEEAALIYTDPETGDTLRAAVTPLLPKEPTLFGNIGPVVGTHTGPRAAGIALLLKHAPKG